MNEHTAPKKKLARRRRANVPGGRHHSHVVRVTPEEEAQLVQRSEAQRVSVPRLMIESALSDTGETPTQRRAAMTELFAFRRQLTGLATNVNQLARAANTDGQTPVGTRAAIAEVRVVVEQLDAAIEELGRS